MLDETDRSGTAPVKATVFHRAEAIEIAIRTAVVAHLVVCILSLVLLAVLESGLGVLIGFGVAALLASAIPFLVLPAAAAIGYLVHLACRHAPEYILIVVRAAVILFEATIFGWIVYAITLWRS